MIIDVSEALGRCVEALTMGGTIIYPTETLYGIGADYTNARAVASVRALKRRPLEKNFNVIVDSIDTARRYFVVTRDVEKLVAAFMPGPLTLIVENKESGTTAFRISSHPFARELCKRFKKPIVSTTVNMSCEQPLSKIHEISAAFDDRVAVIVDAGDLPTAQPSTVFDVATRQLFRNGRISLSDIMACLA